VTPILALTPDVNVARRLSLLWGAHPISTEDLQSYEEMIAQAQSYAVSAEFAKPQDRVVAVAGIPFGKAGSTNNLRVLKIE
jgi:pyruvate kinase